MTAETILALVAQGLAVLPTLIETGVNVTSRIEQIAALAKAGTSVTDEQLAAYRAQLDRDLADFNQPMT